MSRVSRQYTRRARPSDVARALEAADRRNGPADPLDTTLRRWEVARTDRLNSAHWSRATGQPINADLVGSLKNLRARCAFEASNNPIVEGLINSHANDIVGENGPKLQVISDNDDYNAGVEWLWSQWSRPTADGPLPDLAGKLSLADLLRQCVWLWWTKGEHVWQMTSAADVPLDQLALRVQSIDPDRLDTAPGSGGDPNVALGVRRDRHGRPVGYQIKDETHVGPFALLGGRFQEYGADEIIHQFEALEPGQLRGVPWLASCLQTVADLRDFDKQVLDAARLAASQGVVWYTDHPDAPFYEVNETVELERNCERTGPPGWKPHMIDPKQPTNNYVAFRTERLRELGRGRSIPLMKILLGSERHNFASARMDGLNYQRAIAALQKWTERGTLSRLLAAVLREGQFLRTRRGEFVLPPRPVETKGRFKGQPGHVSFMWHWPKQPKVDPVKEATAQQIQLNQTGTLPFAEACADDGRDEDEVIASRARTNRKLIAAGLPPIATTPPASQAAPPDDDERKPDDEREGARRIDDDGFDDEEVPQPDPNEIGDYGQAIAR